MDLDLNKSVASQIKKMEDDPPLTNDPKVAKLHKVLNVVSSSILYPYYTWNLAKILTNACWKEARSES
jgi:hypothetical protein